MSERQFPILGAARASIPWSWLEPHRGQAIKNHGQTLEQLASRGGLSPQEAIAVVKGRPLSFSRGLTEEEAFAWLDAAAGIMSVLRTRLEKVRDELDMAKGYWGIDAVSMRESFSRALRMLEEILEGGGT